MKPSPNKSNDMKQRESISQTSRLSAFFQSVLPQANIDLSRNSRLVGNRKNKAHGSTAEVKIQNFTYHAPEVTSVQLEGDFTRWQERPINLRRWRNGMWWAALRLERGTHYYRFLVDGQWRDDLECPLVVSNPFGSLNAVRQVNW